jgi:hypothetical protein
LSCHAVHVGSAGRLQWGQAAQFIKGVVGHAIAQEYNVFHWDFTWVLDYFIGYKGLSLAFFVYRHC